MDYTAEWDVESVESTENAEPVLNVRVAEDGFHSVTGRPAGTRKTVGLALEDNPKPGVYVFAPTVDDCEFSVTIEFDDEPYPAPVVYARELDTPLSHAEVGNAIEIRLRATGVESPETIKLNGTICKIVDWSCSILSKSRTYSPPLTVSSILVTTGDMTEKLEEVCRSPLFENGVDIQPFGDETGTLNLVGVDNPRLIWESDLIDGAPPVESVRILSEDDSEIIVQNPSLPELDFDPLGDHAVDDRVDIITRILSQTDLIISSEAITQFARAVDQSHEELVVSHSGLEFSSN